MESTVGNLLVFELKAFILMFSITFLSYAQIEILTDVIMNLNHTFYNIVG